MGEDVASHGKGPFLECCGRALDDGVVSPRLPIGDTAEGVIAPTVVHFPVPAFGKGSWVPERESELA